MSEIVNLSYISNDDVLLYGVFVCLGLGIITTGVDLNWVMLNGFTATLPCFPPVVLSIFWSKTSKAGVISGRRDRE